MQFYIQSSIVEKGVPVKDLIYSRIDAFTGAIIVNVVAFFIVVMCASIIYTNGVHVNSVADVSAALLPLAGQYAGVLLYTSDAADEEDSVDLGGRRIIQ